MLNFYENTIIIDTDTPNIISKNGGKRRNKTTEKKPKTTEKKPKTTEKKPKTTEKNTKLNRSIKDKK